VTNPKVSPKKFNSVQYTDGKMYYAPKHGDPILDVVHRHPRPVEFLNTYTKVIQTLYACERK